MKKALRIFSRLLLCVGMCVCHELSVDGVVRDRVLGGKVERLCDTNGNAAEVLDVRCGEVLSGFSATEREVTCMRCGNAREKHTLTYPPYPPYFVLDKDKMRVEMKTQGPEPREIRGEGETNSAFLILEKVERKTRSGLIGKRCFTERIRVRNIDKNRVARGFQAYASPNRTIRYYDDLGEIYRQGVYGDILHFEFRYPLRPGEAIEFMMRTETTGRVGERERNPFDNYFCEDYREKECRALDVVSVERRGRGALANAAVSARIRGGKTGFEVLSAMRIFFFVLCGVYFRGRFGKLCAGRERAPSLGKKKPCLA